MAVVGKLRGWDRTVPTPAVDWTKTVVDVVVPAKNEEQTIALALASLVRQDFSIRDIIVFDDASTDSTGAVVRSYSEKAGRAVKLVTRPKSIGKTPALREYCETSDADALVILDADTVLASPNYVSRLIEELFRNAGVAASCGEVMPLTLRRRKQLVEGDAGVKAVWEEFRLTPPGGESFWLRLATTATILYRTPMYVLLQRVLYDGNLKLFGAQLNPVGCAVAYKTDRLRACFAYAQPRVGDNLSMSEDIYIGHFFNWKGWRSVQILGVRCESTEPPIHRLPRQLFLWSSGMLQSSYYFLDLPLTPWLYFRRLLAGDVGNAEQAPQARLIQEQYRAPWGENITHKRGRGIGWFESISLVEKTMYPPVLAYFAVFDREVFWLTLAAETVLGMGLLAVTADRGSRWKYAAMMVPALPVRVMSLGVDTFAIVHCLIDIASGNRRWRK